MKPVLVTLPLLFVLVTRAYANCKGCVNLDEYNFDKVIGKFRITLVKFDVAYPYGDKHETFTKLAEELATHQEILIAEVGVKDYGDKENEALAAKYGVKSKDDYPQVQLFVDGKASGAFSKSHSWTVDNLRNLIRDNANVYIGLPGCIQRFDVLAKEFVSDEAARHNTLKTAEALLQQSDENEKSSAKIYLLYMQKIIENGSKFVEKEVKRLSKILKDSKLNKKKQDEMGLRLNVLHSFKAGSLNEGKEEL